jgi:parallel beta-helix repeat protein
MVLMLISIGVFLSMFNIQPLKAFGKVYIKADGSVDPSTVPIYRDGLVYVVESDLYCSIVVEKDDVVVDGASHFIYGVGNGVGIHLPNVKNVTVKGFKIQEFSVGVLLEKSSFCSVFGNNISLCNDGIVLVFSSNNSICENSVIANYGDGIKIYYFSNGNSICRNSLVLNHYDSITISTSSDNVICENNIKSSDIGVLLFRSSYNHIFHNNFLNNTFQAHAHADSLNVWDNGYPSGGNYWEGHNPPDKNLDRLGDIQYVVNGENVDNYPLIYPFEFYKQDHKAEPDVNNDGVVNMFDLYVIVKAYGCKPGDYRWNPLADLDMDGIISIIDLHKVVKNFAA